MRHSLLSSLLLVCCPICCLALQVMTMSLVMFSPVSFFADRGMRIKSDEELYAGRRSYQHDDLEGMQVDANRKTWVSFVVHGHLMWHLGFVSVSATVCSFACCCPQKNMFGLFAGTICQLEGLTPTRPCECARNDRLKWTLLKCPMCRGTGWTTRGQAE